MTSPEAGSLFGAVMARVIDDQWHAAGCPDPWIVIEAGAAGGALASAVVQAEPACLPALRYVAVERSPALRARARERWANDGIPAVDPALLLGASVAGDEADSGGRRVVASQGPIVTDLSELPAGCWNGMVVTNELLDNLPFDLAERRDGHWFDVRVGERDGAPAEVLVPAAVETATEAGSLISEGADSEGPEGSGRDGRHRVPPPVSQRVPLQHTAREWLAAALGATERGVVICVDYCSTTPELAARPPSQWLRTYRAHGRTTDPLAACGLQDITCEVAVDQLARVRPPSVDSSQTEWLRANGMDDLVRDARARWEAGVARPDLAVLAARSRIHEAAALSDPNGLGGFRVLQWTEGPRRRTVGSRP